VRFIHDVLRQRLLAEVDAFCSCGKLRLEDLAVSEWSDLFERRMRSRLIQGSLRYGRMRDPTKACFDNVGGAMAHLEAYLRDGNQEHLVDAANLCMLESERPVCHPSPHFRSEHDVNHVRRIR
jgi:hypothetical protein